MTIAVRLHCYPFFVNLDLTWGLLHGDLVHIDDVENGLSCNCCCPECHGILVAKQGTGLRRPHFAHHIDAAPACNNAQESALHRIAKEILLRNDAINLPEARNAETHEIIDSAGYLSYTNPRAEVREGDLRPDILIDAAWGILRLEIFVSHRVDHRRLRKIQRADSPTVEITLGSGMRFTRTRIKQAVLHDVDNKRWIHPRAYKSRSKPRKVLPHLPEEPPKPLPMTVPCRVCRVEKEWSIFDAATGTGVCSDCLPAYNASNCIPTPAMIVSHDAKRRT